MGRSLPKRQRVAAYAVILRDDRILLTRLAPRISPDELWTLPGGGLDHGEDPRDAVRPRGPRGDRAGGDGRRDRPGLLRAPARRLARRPAGRRARAADRVRRLGAGRTRRSPAWSRSTGRPSRPPGSRSPTCSTAASRSCRWCSRRWPTTGRSGMQRLAAYALIRRDDAVLLTRISGRGAHPGSWTLPGGGIDHGESPRRPWSARCARSAGWTCAVGELVAVHDDHFSGTAPTGRYEDFHGVHLVFAATVPDDARAAGGRGRRHHRRGRLGARRGHRVRAAAGARRGPAGARSGRQRRRLGRVLGAVAQQALELGDVP